MQFLVYLTESFRNLISIRFLNNANIKYRINLEVDLLKKVHSKLNNESDILPSLNSYVNFN